MSNGKAAPERIKQTRPIQLSETKQSTDKGRRPMHTLRRRSSQVARAALAALGLISCASFAAEEPAGLKRPCTVSGGVVEVTVTPILGIPQRCYEVAYHEQRAYVCVAAGGTPEGPYSYSLDRFEPERVTKDGWTGGGNFGHTAEEAFQGACSVSVMRHEREKAKLEFDPDKAGRALDEFFGWGPGE
ncbi:MAG: hypothetical protein OXU81_23690 [Gammaproteobacteria bacterium]|nr:hypothetical protein [Gammaproteobacteria bacterium]